jgi:hypothetical protein
MKMEWSDCDETIYAIFLLISLLGGAVRSIVVIISMGSCLLLHCIVFADTFQNKLYCSNKVLCSTASLALSIHRID